MEKEMEIKLQSTGLSEYESKIYFDLLKSGKAKGASKIGVSTKLNRQYVYRGLNNLLDLGLVTKVPIGKWHKFKAESENQLLKIQKKKLNETEDLVAELKKYSKTNIEQDFEIVIGLENFKKFEVNRYKNVSKNSIQYAILASSDRYLEIMGDAYNDIGIEYARKNNVKYMMIGGEIPENIDLVKSVIGDNFRFKKLSNFNSGNVSTLVCENFVCFYTYVNPPTIYVIYSPKVAESYRNFFLSLWEKL